jgi:hypothetical protein
MMEAPSTGTHDGFPLSPDDRYPMTVPAPTVGHDRLPASSEARYVMRVPPPTGGHESLPSARETPRVPELLLERSDDVIAFALAIAADQRAPAENSVHQQRIAAFSASRRQLLIVDAVRSTSAASANVVVHGLHQRDTRDGGMLINYNRIAVKVSSIRALVDALLEAERVLTTPPDPAVASHTTTEV